MKKAIFIFIFIVFTDIGHLTAEESSNLFFDQANRLFSQVVKNNRVDYETLFTNQQPLVQVLDLAKEINVSNLSQNEAKAYWINLYNLLVLRRVLDKFPIVSPMDVPGFFTKPFFRLGRKKYSLDDIEKGILYKHFPDPRLHFVLVCAAIGCPPLAPFAYNPQNLESQLTSQTRKTLNDNHFIRLDNEKSSLRVSEIFQWYRKDFVSKSKSISDYINTHRDIPIPANFKVDFYPYDWRLNGSKKQATKPELKEQSSTLKSYTPAILLPSGGYEIKVFNNLYSQTAYYDTDGDRVDLNQRQNYFTMHIQLLVGVSKNKRLNIGFDTYFKSVYLDPNPDASPFNIFSFSGANSQRTAITTIGPKVKIAPFRSIPYLSIQSSFLFPVASNLEGNGVDKPFLEYQRSVWWTQLFYDYTLSNRVKIFSELDFLLRFKSDYNLNDTQVLIPASLFVSYFPSSRTTVYGMVQYSPTLSEASTYYWQYGLGGKLQVNRNLELELLVTSFFTGSNSGAGVTYNIGLRYLKQ